MEMQQDSDQESVGSKDSSVVSSRQSDSELQGVSGDEPEEIDDQDSENSDVSNSDADEDHNSLEEFPEIKDNANFNSNSVSRATNNSNSYENSESSGSEDEDNSGAESDANADANIHDNSQSYLAKSPPRKIVVPMSEKNIKKPRVTSGKGKARTVRKSSPDAGTTAKNGRAGVRARKSMDGDASSHARRRSSRPRTTKEHNSDASEDFSASEEEDDNSNYPAIKKYFLERLQQELMPLGAKKNELNAFRIRVTKKTSGLSTGLLEIKYCSHKNKKFKSRVEVGISLGVITAVRNIRNLKTEEHFMNSQEFREVVLISQKLAVQTLPIDSVSFVNDDIVFVSRERPADKEQTVNSINHKFFSCGNVTVLSWGKIVPFPAFHNPNHLFPVGFKCIRQEHDIRIDRVVDCLCEIDVENRNPTEKVTNERYTITEDSIPVFRLTISWKLRSGQNILRVYEARSAKLAWNAAMTEKVGIHETISHIKAKEVLMDGDMQVSGLSSDWFKKAHCSFDEEELSIRKSIRSKQTEFFKAIREEQKQGISGEMKPRLFLETTDSFTEDIILRMFEGMQNSYECEDYQFLDSREKDGGRKLIFKAYSRLISKMKALDKVIRKHAQAEDHMALVISKRTREEYFESRKKAKLENKEQKEKLMIIQRKKQSRIKELEKVISVMKSNLSKEVKRRREEAKLYVESLCDKENAELLTKDRSITSASSSALESLSNAMDVDKSGDDASKTSRPKPVNGPVLMDGNVFGKVLEIWEYLHTFAESLKIENIPSIDDFMTALRIHDSTCKQLADYSLPYQNTFGFAASSAGRNKTMTPFEAEQLLNKVGIMFAKTLMGEYEKIIGLDSVSAQIGSLRIPANEISWREITRVALLGAVCKEVGMSDADLAVMVK